MGHGITIRTPLPFAAAVAAIRDALRAQGLGVLIVMAGEPALLSVEDEAGARLRAAVLESLKENSCVVA